MATESIQTWRGSHYNSLIFLYDQISYINKKKINKTVCCAHTLYVWLYIIARDWQKYPWDIQHVSLKIQSWTHNNDIAYNLYCTSTQRNKGPGGQLTPELIRPSSALDLGQIRRSVSRGRGGPWDDNLEVIAAWNDHIHLWSLKDLILNVADMTQIELYY